MVSISNRMVLGAIWIKHTRVGFSKSVKVARVRMTSAILCSLKNSRIYFM